MAGVVHPHRLLPVEGEQDCLAREELHLAARLARQALTMALLAAHRRATLQTAHQFKAAQVEAGVRQLVQRLAA